MRIVVALALLLMVGMVAPLAAASRATAAEPDMIEIEADRLAPPALKTATERRVTFVNRSGWPAHVDLTGRSGEHHVFQVRGQIWAIFHRAGVHPYAVHLEKWRNVVTLHGAVEAVDEPEVSHPTCNDLTVMGVCIGR